MTKSGMVYQPIDYVSHVTVTGNDGIPSTMTVRVNHPIDVDGTLYYQASYGFGMRFRVTHDGVRDRRRFRTARCMEGDSLDAPRHAAQRALRALRSDGRPAERACRRADPRVNDPARRARASRRAATPLGEALVPLGTWIDLGDGWRVTPAAIRALQRFSVPLRSRAFRWSASARSCCWPG